ncbi:aminoacyl-tRNA hydrolase [Brucella intermedia]|uniref:aminoacyl-tRNA hydrolase n=1 Tax=Brucella TaxID=234 RepID=UPI0007C2DE23|nr:aminoacyl-tRNA hydrolase [Brucella intermedia]PJT27445.1 aminoacyl-tRNA hydrolase [Ochrobactrum sp. 30A/1000/2015]PJT38987.1 aminoacyl-tRNA hydrolase [Ochrobactrum sp. 27A/999/2015]PJT44882.1 aminoacyl-tRNA hydrolase [Ochrobactrum sp. 23A/997/2015]KAB2714916.1 aminoacyl-tRNA hydrolase [Brucella intermedia]MDL2204088.1 aminoacyl-tRNA hydrolase [Brucella intermedia]
MLLIAGLGNPGPKYAHNRHNIGFMAADEIFRRHRFSNWQKKFQAEIADGVIDGEKVLLIKPQTFMNLSGQSVGEAMRFYKLTPADLVVIYDELDLNPGKLRIKTGGGSGGHNGIKSIDAHMQSFSGGQNYRRMRLGIGHPGAKELVHNYVLGDFAKVDNEWLDTLLGAVADNVAMLARGEDNSFMNRVALAMGDGNQRPNGFKADPAQLEKAPPEAKAKTQSHIRQARPNQKKPNIPESGPMADMLKRLFGKKD